jgi:hypothetical protein
VKVKPYYLHCMIAGKKRPLETVSCKTGTGAKMSASCDQTHRCTIFCSHCYVENLSLFLQGHVVVLNVFLNWMYL